MKLREILSALFNGLFVAPTSWSESVGSEYRNELRIRLGA